MASKTTNRSVPSETPVNTEKTWSEDEARGLCQAFDTAERPPRALSGRELVQTRLLPGIKKKLRAGWSYDEICQTLEALGISIAKSTLQGYVSRSKKRASAAKKDSSKAPAASDRAEAQSSLQARPEKQANHPRSDASDGKPSAEQPGSGRSRSLPTVLNDEV